MSSTLSTGPWEERLAALQVRFLPSSRFVTVRLVPRPGEVETLRLPDPRDAADEWLTPALRERQARVIARDLGDRSLWLLPIDGTRADAKPLDVEALAASVARLVATLPERPDADVWSALRRLALDEPARAQRYLVEVVKAACRERQPHPPVRLPAALRPRPVAASTAARSSAYRDRKRERSEAAAREWLAMPENLDAWAKGVTSTALWSQAKAALTEWADDEPETYAVPGRNALLAVAAEVLDQRVRRGVRVFVPRS